MWHGEAYVTPESLAFPICDDALLTGQRGQLLSSVCSSFLVPRSAQYWCVLQQALGTCMQCGETEGPAS